MAEILNERTKKQKLREELETLKREMTHRL